MRVIFVKVRVHLNKKVQNLVQKVDPTIYNI